MCVVGGVAAGVRGKRGRVYQGRGYVCMGAAAWKWLRMGVVDEVDGRLWRGRRSVAEVAGARLGEFVWGKGWASVGCKRFDGLFVLD